LDHLLTPVREDLVETVLVSCRICGSSQYHLLFSADNIRRKAKRFFNVVQCKDCGFKYINPSPTEESLKYYYEDYMAHVPERINGLEKIYYRFFRNTRNARPPGRFLDIGCGNGKYLDFMRSLGWETVGVDAGPGCEFARQVLNLEVYDGNLWEHRFPDSSFDVITLWFVLEHIWDPMRLLSECYRILKPGGQIIISTLNTNSFETKVFKRYWWHLLVPEHLCQFDESSLQSVIQKTGFRIFYLRHEPICCGILGSLQNLLSSKKIPLNINITFFRILFIPIDFLCALLKSSGLITAYAEKTPS